MPEKPPGTIAVERFLKVLRDEGYSHKREAPHRQIYSKGTARVLVRKSKWLAEGEVLELLKLLGWTHQKAEEFVCTNRI
jgi:hypothetical protein